MSFFVQNVVAARIAKQTYGVTCITTYDAQNPEHILREHLKMVRPSGRVCIPNSFNVLLAKVRWYLHSVGQTVIDNEHREQELARTRKYPSGLTRKQHILERWTQFYAISRVTRARQ